MPNEDKKPQPVEVQWKVLNLRVFWWFAGIGGLVTLSILMVLSLTAALARDPAVAQLWIDVVTRSLAVLAGAGGAFGLWLAFRRQQYLEAKQREDMTQAKDTHQQRIKEAEAAALDAIERRITELRIQAIAQLGSESSAVRIGGLHNLERLGEQQEGLRQIVIDEVCAYLRMPYTPDSSREWAPGRPERSADDAVDYSIASLPVVAAVRQEAEVRSTAQRILQRHLSIGEDETADSYWKHDRLDLTGATFDNLDLSDSQLHNATFENAVFQGETSFDGADFHDRAKFTGAVFDEDVSFEGATFEPAFEFESVTVGGDGSIGEANYNNAVFKDAAVFNYSTFYEGARFAKANFAKLADFTGARLGSATFSSTVFHNAAHFLGAEFQGGTDFEDVEFVVVSFVEATFHGITRFTDVTVGQELVMHEAFAPFDLAHSWPPGWRLRPGSRGPSWGQLIPEPDHE